MRCGWLVSLVACGALLGGCAADVQSEDTSPSSGDPIPDPGPDPDPQAQCEAGAWDGAFEVGTGNPCFVAVSGEVSVPLIAGPQGGYHVWMGIRCRDCGDKATVEYGVQDPVSGEFVYGGYSSSEVLVLDAAPGYHQGASLQAYMPGDSWEGTDPEYLGESFRLWASVTIDGVKLEDEALVKLEGVEYWDPCDTDPDQCFDDNI